MTPAGRFAVAALAAALALMGALAASPGSAQQRQLTTLGRIALPERPQRSADADQETLALQVAETLGMACRATEMYRWAFAEDDPPRAQRIVAAGERALRERGYVVALLPVEIDTLTAMHGRLPPGQPAGGQSARSQPDDNLLALWSVGEQGVDLTLCRVR